MSKATTEEETPHKRTSILRYVSPEHHELVRKSADYAGLSINAWICRVTLKAARREAAEAEHLAQAGTEA